MRVLDQRVREAKWQRTRTRAAIAAIAIPVIYLAACSEATVPPTAPPAATEQSLTKYAPGERPPNFEASLVYCTVALKSSPGKYRVRDVPVKVPREIFDPQGKTAKAGFRGWASRETDPASLILCQLPATQAATDFFKEGFSVDSLVHPKMPWRESAGSAKVSSLAGDGVAIYDAQAASCETELIRDPSCDEPAPEQPTDEGPPPVQDEPPDFTIGEAPPDYSYDEGLGAYLVQTLGCWGQTDNPHLSTTFGFFGNVNVHARTWCNFSTAITVSTILSRQSCFLWFFCWWTPQGLPGFNATFGLSTEAHSNSSGCSRGYYKGSSYHTALFPSGNGTARTSNIKYIYC